MRKFLWIAVLLLGTGLILAPSVGAETRTFTWTGNPETDPSVFPSVSQSEVPGSYPHECVLCDPEDLPNEEGRIGGSPIYYEENSPYGEDGYRICFESLGPEQGVHPDTEQWVLFPDPPNYKAVQMGDFVYEVDMAMQDMEQVGGFWYMGPQVIFLATEINGRGTGMGIEIIYVNWGGAPSPYIYTEQFWQGVSVNDEHVLWDPLLSEPGAGGVSFRIAMTGEIVVGSYRAPGGVWSQLWSYDMAQRPAQRALDRGHRVTFMNRGTAGQGFCVDGMRYTADVDLTPQVEFKDSVGTNREWGSFYYEAPAHWIPVGGVFNNPGATATEILPDAGSNDVTDQMVITSWNTLTPDVVLPGETGVDLNSPGEYIINHHVTDYAGRTVDRPLRIYVYEEGKEWAFYSDHWYRMNGLMPWLSHRAYAASVGGYVTSITDWDENDFVLFTFKQPSMPLMKDHWRQVVLLGLNDYLVSGVYQWDNGEPADFINFIHEEPNNWADGGWGPEHVAAMGLAFWPGAWMDYDPNPSIPWPTWDWMNEKTQYMPAIIETEVDPLPPVLTLNGDRQKSVALGSKYVEEGASVLDNLDPDLSDSVEVTYTPPLPVDPEETTTVGEYLAEYTVSDTAGNAATPVTRKIFVLSGSDERPPESTLLGCLGSAGPGCMNLLEVGDTYVHGGVEVFDDWNGNITDTADIQTYSLAGLALEVNASETVHFAPCLIGPGCLDQVDIPSSLAGDGAVVLIGDAVSWYELQVNPASPNQKLGWEEVAEMDLTGVAPLDSEIDASTIGGVYVTRYNAVDSSDNVATTVDRLVLVKDVPPRIVLVGDLAMGLRVGEVYEEFGAELTDLEDCEGSIASPGLCDEDDEPEIYNRLEIEGDVDGNTVGTYLVTYNVMDSFGNPAQQVTRTVTVYEPYVVQKTEKEPETVSDLDSGCFVRALFAR